MCPTTQKSGDENEINTKQTLTTIIKNLKVIVTVEPLIACYQMAICITKPALSNMEFEKACRVNLGYNSTICNAILDGNQAQYKIENDEVQSVISTMHSWQQPIQSFTPLVLILFLRSFSDRHKWRKPFLLIPIVGELFGVAGCILCTFFMDQLPLEAQGIFQDIIPSLFGGQTMLVMATTAYIADISTIQMRTLRLGVVQIVRSVVLPLVQSISGIFYIKAGYFSVLGSAAILNCTALSYGFFWIKESRTLNHDKFNKNILVDILNPKHARDTFSLLLKKSTDNDRVFIWLLIIMSFLHGSAFTGESNLLYLYTQKVFSWTPLEYSYFLTTTSVVALVGHLLGVPLFTRVLHLSDITILVIATLNKIVTNLLFGMAKDEILFYTGLGIGIVSRTYRTAKQSLFTKIVSKDDIGKAQSLIGIWDILAPAAFVPVYNKLIYINTLNSFPAAFLFFSILLYGMCCILILLMYCQMNRRLCKISPLETESVFTATMNDIQEIESVHL